MFGSLREQSHGLTREQGFRSEFNKISLPFNRLGSSIAAAANLAVPAPPSTLTRHDDEETEKLTPPGRGSSGHLEVPRLSPLLTAGN